METTVRQPEFCFLPDGAEPNGRIICGNELSEDFTLDMVCSNCHRQE